MNACRLCRSTTLRAALSFGPQPICNRYLAEPNAPEFTHPLSFIQCETCGLAQLGKVIPAEELTPRVDWISYNEPEPHLDAVADTIAKLPGLNPQSKILGVTVKDESLLARLNKLGFKNTSYLNAAEDLGIESKSAGMEMIQKKLDATTARRIAAAKGAADLVLARHVFEHAHDAAGFLRAMKELLREGGYLFTEVPDCRDAFRKLDYSVAWEEHALYFTPATFRSAISFGGFDVIDYDSYPYPLENSLVGISQARAQAAPLYLDKPSLGEEKKLVEFFSRSFPETRSSLRNFLATAKAKNGKVAVFGAGHSACVFLNIFELKNLIDFVVDDHPKKMGTFMPGSRIPIVPSSKLVEDKIQLCLLAVNPAIEDKLIAKNSAYTASGGSFVSIFPKSSRARKN